MKRSIALILILLFFIGAYDFIGNRLSEKYGGVSLNVTILVASEFGDKSINDSAHDGGEALKDDGMVVGYIECGNKDYKKQMMSAAHSSDVVVCVGPEFWEITDVAIDNPNVKFIWAGSAVDEPSEYPNILNVLYAQNEGAYLAGYIASAVSQSGILGVVGGSEDLVTEDYIAGFTQGAEDCNGHTKILRAFANGDYDNPELGKTLADSLYVQGADVVLSVAGNTGSGVYMSAAERGRYAIGSDRDQKTEFPEYDDCILCSIRKDIAKSVRKLVVQYAREETFEGGTVVYADMAKGYVDLTYGDSSSVQQVDRSLREEIAEIKKDIIDGKITVESAVQQ